MQVSFSEIGAIGPVRRDLVGGHPEPLEFAFWNVQGNIVRDNIARFAAEAGEGVVCLEISGDYEDALAGPFSRGKGPDVFYAQRAEASLWGAEGKIQSTDETRFAPLLARMDQRMVQGARDAQGRLLGLTYYNGGPFALFAHARFADEGNLAFDTWQDVLNFLRRSKRDGVAEHPFLPRWHSSQTGLVWSLICHLATEGVTDLNASALLTLESTLHFFETLVAEDLVPPESLDERGDRPALVRWTSGQHILSFTTDYLAIDAAKAAGQPVNIVLDLPGKSKTPLMPGHALLCLRSGLTGTRRERAERLLTFLGGPSADSSLAVHERWLRECLFGVPYPEATTLPGMRDAMLTAFAPQNAEPSLDRLLSARAAAVMSPPTQRPAMLEWTRFADRLVREDLLRHRSLKAKAAAAALLDAWARLDRA